jgi:hypothetical protein
MKKTSQFNTAELAEIQAIQEKSNITRKSAIRKFEKSGRKIVITAGFAQKNQGVTVSPASVTLSDGKSAAANDDTNKQPEAPKAPVTPKPVVPQTAAGAARGEGIRLYKLSNVATLAKDEGVKTEVLFKHVYGPMGAKWTWEQRAKAVGLATAEEAAREFQRMRGGKPQEFVKAEPTTEKK